MKAGDKGIIKKIVPENWIICGRKPDNIVDPIYENNSWTEEMDWEIGQQVTIQFINFDTGVVVFEEVGYTWPISAIASPTQALSAKGVKIRYSLINLITICYSE